MIGESRSSSEQLGSNVEVFLILSLLLKISLIKQIFLHLMLLLKLLVLVSMVVVLLLLLMKYVNLQREHKKLQVKLRPTLVF